MTDQTVGEKRPAFSLDDTIMNTIPLMAPVPTAWMIGLSTYTLMRFPLPVAVVSALTVEGIGFVSINTANEMREFNRHLNAIEIKQMMEAPTKQAYAVAGLYLTTATLMTVVLHIVPDWVWVAPIPFILMTAAGGWLWALRREHAERVAKWTEQRAQATLQRKSATLQRRSAKVSDADSDAQRGSATLSEKTSDAQRRSAKPTAKIYRCECGWQGHTPQQYSGHCRQCVTHKAGKLIPVDIRQTEKV